MTTTDQLRSDLLDVLQLLKEAHHALADGTPDIALGQIELAQQQLGTVQTRLAQSLQPASL